MPVLVLVGAQWGDEGKGKITDMIAKSVDIVVRYQGGSNAGHTVVVDGKEYVLHMIPSGILYEDKMCIIGDGLVIDIPILLNEIKDLTRKGISANNLRISYRAHVVMPYHKTLDEKEEELRGKHKIGTTKRGIGPAYVDKMSRIGIRVSDLYDIDEFRGRLGYALKYKNLILREIFGHDGFSEKEIEEEYMEYAKKLKPYVADTSLILDNAIKENKTILLEGAQGTLLDIDYGTYPYVTSSHPVAGGACIGSGISPTKITRVIGVTKAYTTRVGEGPFPTELNNKIGEHLREKGCEFGATTGRARRCGWLDTLMLRYSARINGFDTLAMTKLDVLDFLDVIKICISYKINGKIINEFTTDYRLLRDCEPIYEEVEGWKQDTSGIKTYEDLPKQVKEYLARIEKRIITPISIISLGPSRDQSVILRKFL